MSEARILLTGFEPFGGEAINPSWEVAQALDGQQLEGARVMARCLPCAFGPAQLALREALRETRPELVLALGQAGGRCDISVERVAINCVDARIADNVGEQPVDVPVQREGPAAYFSTLPIKAIVAGLRAAGYPASVSQTAGTFVCNAVFYGLMHELQGGGAQARVRSGFIHIPYLPEQAARHPGQPSLPLVTLIDAVRLALTVARQTGQDLVVSGGAIS